MARPPALSCARMETRPSDRRSPARMAPAPPPEPARSRARGRDFDQASELPRNRARAALARHGAAPRRAARRARCASATCCSSRPATRRCFRSGRSTTRRCKQARKAVDLVLKGHEPYPAIAIDRHWTLVAHNAAVPRADRRRPTPTLLQPPVNVLRLSLHPEGARAAHREPRRMARASARRACASRST